MKKIIALILLVVLSVSLLAGCEMGNAAKTETEWVLDCYARSYPHLIKVNSTQQFGGTVLNSETVIVRGSVGGDFVACMTVNGEQMRSIQDNCLTLGLKQFVYQQLNVLHHWSYLEILHFA